MCNKHPSGIRKGYNPSLPWMVDLTTCQPILFSDQYSYLLLTSRGGCDVCRCQPHQCFSLHLSSQEDHADLDKCSNSFSCGVSILLKTNRDAWKIKKSRNALVHHRRMGGGGEEVLLSLEVRIVENGKWGGKWKINWGDFVKTHLEVSGGVGACMKLWLHQ